MCPAPKLNHYFTISAHKGPVNVLSGDEKYLYSGSSDGLIYVWRKNTWDEEATIELDSPVTALANDDSQIYVNSNDNHWGCLTTFRKGSWGGIEEPGGSAICGSGAVTQDETAVYWTYRDDRNLPCVMALSKQNEFVYYLRVDQEEYGLAVDDRNLFTANGWIWPKNTWDERTIVGDEVAGYTHHYSELQHLSWNDRENDPQAPASMDVGPLNQVIALDNQYIYRDFRHNLRVWDRLTFRPCAELNGHFGRILAVATDDEFVYSGSEDNTIRVWKKGTWNLVTAITGHTGVINALWRDKTFLYSGSEDTTIKIWQIE